MSLREMALGRVNALSGGGFDLALAWLAFLSWLVLWQQSRDMRLHGMERSALLTWEIGVVTFREQQRACGLLRRCSLFLWRFSLRSSNSCFNRGSSSDKASKAPFFSC